MECKKFGYRLREARTDKGLTGSKLGAIIGVPKGAIAHWEAGDYFPNNDRIIALANALDVSIDFLMCRTDCKQPVSVLTDSGDRIVDLNEFKPEQQELIKALINQFKK